MNLTLQERETVILYNEAEQTASVYTYNAALRRKLSALASERPTECIAVRFNEEDGAVEYTVPKKWIKINPTRILSEVQRAILAERAKANLSINPPIITEL